MSADSCEEWTDEKLGTEIDRLFDITYRAVRRRNCLVKLWNERHPPPPQVSLLRRAMSLLKFGKKG